MTDHTDRLIEQRIADMTPEQFDALVARTRPPEVAALKERAAAMLRGETPPAAEPATGAEGISAPTGAGAQRPALRGEKNLGPYSLFDTDHDGTLSPAEIVAAAEVLRQLDKNHDGSLTSDELPRRRPPPPLRDRRAGADDNDHPLPPPQN